MDSTDEKLVVWALALQGLEANAQEFERRDNAHAWDDLESREQARAMHNKQTEIVERFHLEIQQEMAESLRVQKLALNHLIFSCLERNGGPVPFEQIAEFIDNPGQEQKIKDRLAVLEDEGLLYEVPGRGYLKRRAA
jgi:hypothetical protein